MENPEEILHSLEEFSKLRPKSIPRELEEYLCFVAKTGDPVYQWSVIKCLFREKLINVITEFYESCPSVNIPSCRNVDIFNYDTMKTFILEKLDTFVAAPFTVQRICELLTTPRKEYNRIDKYMRALEKNILVVSTTEPGNHRTPENGDGFINGIESDHVQDGSHDINIEEMDDAPIWPPKNEDSYQSTSKEDHSMVEKIYSARENNVETEIETEPVQENEPEAATSQAIETVICSPSDEQSTGINIPTPINNAECDVNVSKEEKLETEDANEGNSDAVPAVVQRRRNSIEPPTEQTEIQSIVPTHENTPVVQSPEEAEIEMDKPEISLPITEHLLQAGDTIKNEVLPTEEIKASGEPFIQETTPLIDIAAAGDAMHHSVIHTDTSIQESNEAQINIELSEHVEIDVTSFTATKQEELLSPALPVEMQMQIQPEAEECLASIEQDKDQDQEATQVILPQAEMLPIDIPQPQELQNPEPDHGTIATIETSLQTESIVMETPEPSENLPITSVTTEIPVDESDVPIEAKPEAILEDIAPVEAPEEDSSISISNEQKALETMDQPDIADIETPSKSILVDNVDVVPPSVDDTMDTDAMDVDVTEPETAIIIETPWISVKDDSIDTADLNN